MSPPRLPSDQRDVIAAHKHDTVLFVLAGNRPCRDWVARVGQAFPAPKRRDYGRRVLVGDFGSVARIDPKKSWALVLVVCPADDLMGVARWAKRLPRGQLRRIRILLHPSASEAQLAPWTTAMGQEPRAARVIAANRLIQEAAAHLNQVTYEDHAPNAARGLAPR